MTFTQTETVKQAANEPTKNSVVYPESSKVSDERRPVKAAAASQDHDRDDIEKKRKRVGKIPFGRLYSNISCVETSAIELYPGDGVVGSLVYIRGIVERVI